MPHPLLKNYSIHFTSHAHDNLLDVEKNDHLAIFTHIEALTSNHTNIDIKKLASNYAHLYRLRVGHFRIIYRIEHQKQIILIIAIGQRKDVYKQLDRFLNK